MCLSLFLAFSLCTDDSWAHGSVTAHGGLGSGGFSKITSLKDTPGPHHYGFQAGETTNFSLLTAVFHMHHGKSQKNFAQFKLQLVKMWHRHDMSKSTTWGVQWNNFLTSLCLLFGVAEPRASEENEVRVFVALFPYDPAVMSPNPDAAEEELCFKEGQIIKVWLGWIWGCDFHTFICL